MDATFEQLMQQAQALQGLQAPQSHQHTPQDIRICIQGLMSQGNAVMAQALTDAALALHPDSEELLAMAGLMALANQDWGDAIALLEQLLQQQGHTAPPMTYRMLVRALRCNLEPARAQRVLALGLAAWPHDAALIDEKDDFLDGPAVMPAPGMRN